MWPLRLIRLFVQSSLQQELAYRANFFINLLHSLLNLGVGVVGLVVLFNQVESVRGWNFPSTLAILGVYLAAVALRGLFIGPSLEALAGLEGEVWSGRFDFTLLRPVNTQFLATFRYWRPFSLVDLALGLAVLVIAVTQPGQTLGAFQLLAFTLAACAGLASLYAILLSFTALVFWIPGILFTWVFDAIFQMARFPVEIYPGWLRLLLTWVVPVGVITSLPARALTGMLPVPLLLGSLLFSIAFMTSASLFFRSSLRRYASASS